MQDKLTPRQSRAWGLCALSVPAAMVLAGRGWLWVLAGSAAAGGIVLFLQTLQRRSGQSLPEQMARAFGQHGGQILGAAVCLWLLLAASGAAAASQIAFEDDLGPLAPAVPLLLAALLRLPPGALRLAPESDPRIARARKIIEERPADPPGNAELARIAGLNRESFVRLFRHECGESPQQFSRRLRIERACRLLHYSNRSIEEIAELCGFADRYHFSRVFSRLMHSAPAVFRRLRH